MRSLYRVVKTSEGAKKRHGSFRYPVFEETDNKQQKVVETGPDEDENDPIRVAELQGDEILSEARQHARKIIEDAKEEAERIRQQAREEGYADGKQEGYDTGFSQGHDEGQEDYRKKKAELEGRVANAIEDIKIVKDRTLERYMDDLKEISLAIGEKIVRTSLRSNKRVVERMIVAATEKLKKSAWAKIYIGSMGEDGIDISADPKFLQEISHLSDNLKIIIMDGQEPGICIVERPDEIIDLSVGTQLENIREIMNNARL